MNVRVLISLAALLVTACCAGPAAPLEPIREAQETFISRAAFAEGKLWLLSDAGLLFAISEVGEHRDKIGLPDPALDLWLWDGTPAIATCPRNDCQEWTLRRWVNGAWHSETTVPTEGDYLLSIHSDATGTTILTNRRIVMVVGNTASSVKLSDPIQARITSTLLTPKNLYIGLNAGEWGGGLRSIDRTTGRVTNIEYKASGQYCFVPLDSACDPVNGIVDDPTKPGCIIIAIGLVHMAPHGRIDEVCGTSVRRIYFKPFGEEDQKSLNEKSEPFSTVAFFGLARHDNTVWAIGIDGLYRFDSVSPPQTVPLPKFKQVDGVWVSFGSPAFVLVLTDINQRLSVSGSTPMFVPR